MSYRVEISPSGRAGCQVAACKKEGKKIAKGELRLGSWVEFNERGSWQWRHWGCVSGEQVVNMQKNIGEDSNGEYRWDAIDGWEDLDGHPDIKEKIKRVITQGHIDPEDFNGDPEMNVPGQKGIHRRQKKAKAEPVPDPASGDEAKNETEGAPKTGKPKKTAPKRGRGKKGEADDEEASELELEKPEKPKKAIGKRGRGKKTEPEDEDVEEAAPPVKKAKRASKKAEPEEEQTPEKPKKAARRKSGAKAAAAIKEESEGEAAPELTQEKPKGKRVTKVAVKKKGDEVSKTEHGPEPPKKRASQSKKGKKEPSISPEPESEPESEAEVVFETGKEDEEEKEEKPAPKAKKGRKDVDKKPAPAPKRRNRKTAA